MSKKFLSIRQAAEASSLSIRRLYLACKDKELKHYLIGKRIVIDEEDLIKFITQKPIEAVDWQEKAKELLK